MKERDELVVVLIDRSQSPGILLAKFLWCAELLIGPYFLKLAHRLTVTDFRRYTNRLTSSVGRQSA